jgi:hypothetical protein
MGMSMHSMIESSNQIKSNVYRHTSLITLERYEPLHPKVSHRSERCRGRESRIKVTTRAIVASGLMR